MTAIIGRAFHAGLLVTCIFLSRPAHAEHLYVVVPVGQQGTLTASGVGQAEQSLRLVPGGADVVPAQVFKDGYALSVRDMLAASPGVIAQQRWGEESRLSIRGSGLSRGFHLRGLTLLQDGIPFNFADGSGDFQEIDPLVLQHVEVYRGGQALRYGAATLGGAVNMVTPSARTAGYKSLLRLEGGSFGTMRAHAEAAHVIEGGDVFAAATKSLGDGFRAQSEHDNTRFAGNAGAALGPDAETRFYVAWNDINQDVPGTVSKWSALHDPKTVPAINIANDYARDINSLRLANRTAFALGDGMTLEIGAYANDKKLYHPIFQVIDQDSFDLGAFSRLQGEWQAGGIRNDFTLGMNAGRGSNDAKRYVNVGGERGALTADAKQIARNIDLYGENRTHVLPDWTLVLGLQAGTARREYDNYLNPANNAEETYRSLNPKIGVLWDILPQAEMYASVTRSSEPPTFSELVQGAFPGFVPVELQKAWTAEIGTRGRQGAFSWDATLYHAWVRDEMLQFSVGPDIPASTFNAGKTVHRGVELGLGWQAFTHTALQLTYTLNDFHFDGDPQFGDNDLAGAPPHYLRLSARYERAGFYIEPNVEWAPQAAWVDYANTLKSDSYALFGLKAGFDVNDHVKIFADARNLTDEKYISTFSTLTDARTSNQDVFYPGDGRAVFAGLSVRF